MKVRNHNRRRKTTNNAWNIDCVEFMRFAASFRWREVEEWFPPDFETDKQTEIEIRLRSHQDENVSLFGSCGLPPDRALMEAERCSTASSVEYAAEAMGVTYDIACRLLTLAKEEARRLTEFEQEQFRYKHGGELPSVADLVPLEGSFTVPGPAFKKAVRREKQVRVDQDHTQLLERLNNLLNQNP